MKSFMILKLWAESNLEGNTVGAVMKTCFIIIRVSISCWAFTMDKLNVLSLYNNSCAALIRPDWRGWATQVNSWSNFFVESKSERWWVVPSYKTCTFSKKERLTTTITNSLLLQGAKHWTVRPFLWTRKSPTLYSFVGQWSRATWQLVVTHEPCWTLGTISAGRENPSTKLTSYQTS